MIGVMLLWSIHLSACIQEASGDWVLEDMATNNPPDGWALMVGTWGTDADQITTPIVTGDSAVEFKSTSVATSIAGSAFTPVEVDGVYKAESIVRASALSGAGHTTRMLLFEYTSSKILIGGTPTVLNADLVTGIANQFQRRHEIFTVGNTTRFVKVGVDKSATLYTVILDRLSMRRTSRGFHAFKSVAQTGIVSGAYTVVEFESAEFDHGTDYDIGLDKWTVPYDSMWQVSWRVPLASLGANVRYETGIDVGSTGSPVKFGEQGVTGTLASNNIVTGGSVLVELSRNDAVTVLVRHLHGSNRTSPANQPEAWFSAHEVR